MTRRWFAGVAAAALGGEPDVGVACSAATGAWLCSLADGGDDRGGGARDLLEAAGAAVAAAPDGALTARGGEHLVAVLVVAARVPAAGERVRAWLASAEIPPVASAAASVLGLRDGPTAPVALERDPWALIGAPRTGLRDACAAVFAATRFGTRRVPAPELRAALAPVTLETLRRHELELGATLLRALLYLGDERSRAARSAAAFLAGQQREDGSVGRLAQEIAAARSIDGFDPVADLVLPTTLAAAWALAETGTPGLRVLPRARA